MEPDYEALLTRVFPNEKTRANYMSRLKALLKKLAAHKPSGLSEILNDPDTWYPRIRELYAPISTRKNILTALLVLLRDDAELTANGTREKWRKLHEDLGKHMDAQIRKSEPSEKQVAQYTSYEEIEAKYASMRDAAPHKTLHDSQQFLLLSILVHLRPKRADLGAVHVYRRDPNRTDINYVVLRKPKDGSSFLSMNLYKTSKFYKKVEEELPPRLVGDLETSLQRWPRDYVFVKDAKSASASEKGKSKKEPMSNNTYTAFVQRTFEALFGRSTGVSMLRHIYISEKVDFENLTLEEQEEEARLMLHTSGLQRQYKWPKKTLCPKLCADYMKKGTRSKRARREGGTRRRRRPVDPRQA